MGAGEKVFVSKRRRSDVRLGTARQGNRSHQVIAVYVNRSSLVSPQLSAPYTDTPTI